MSPEDISRRIEALNENIEKAAKRIGRRRIPGDGDGDGIPNEGKKPGAGGSDALPKGAIGRAKNDKFGDPVFQGKSLSATGKEGTNRISGMKVREHEVVRNGRRTGERYWIGPKNEVFED